MSDPKIDEKVITEAIKALLLKGATGRESKTTGANIDDDMSFAPQAVRSDDEIKMGSSQFSRQLRTAVTLKEKLSIMKEATQGLDVKMSKIDYERLDEAASENQLESNVEVETFISKFSTHLLRYDMRKIFESFPVLDKPLTDEGDRFRNKKTINLLESWDNLGEDKVYKIKEIGATIEWMKKFASDTSSSFLEDIEWSHILLMNSMDEALQDSIHATLEETYPVSQHGGPLTFALMIDKVINLSEGAIEAMVRHLKEYEIRKFPGEDVERVCRRLKYALKRLENNGSLTKDIISGLFRTFQTTSVDDFNSMFSLWKRTIELEGKPKPHYTEILSKAGTWYRNLKIAGEWSIQDVRTTDAAFVAGRKDDIVCYECGQKGHKRPACPLVKQKKTILTTGPTSRDRPISNSPLRYEKQINGKTMKWCAACGGRRGSGKWNETHFTDEHIAGGPNGSGRSQRTFRDEDGGRSGRSQRTFRDEDEGRANLCRATSDDPSDSFGAALAQASSLAEN